MGASGRLSSLQSNYLEYFNYEREKMNIKLLDGAPCQAVARAHRSIVVPYLANKRANPERRSRRFILWSETKSWGGGGVFLTNST